MNLKTTLVLILLAAAGGAFLWFGPTLLPELGLAPQPADTAGAGTAPVLENSLTPDNLLRIEVRKDDRQLVLERSHGGEWNLPGHWPTRKPEVEQLVALITGLHTRFAPIPLTNDADLKAYGLDPAAVTVEVRAAGRTLRLALGEEPNEAARFSRPTYLRLDDNPEVVRLAPGIVAALDKPVDYYQQRRLFPAERVAREGLGETQEKVDRLTAQGLAVKAPEGTFALAKAGDDWELTEPVRDRADPDRLRNLLTAVPDIWAEQFVDRPKKDLDEYGLKTPEKTLRVTRPGGDTATLLVGKSARMKTRTVTRPAPPNQFGMPQQPQRDIVHDEYLFAKLQDNDQVFEIKADKLKDVFVAPDTLRDPRLARFKPEDIRRVELSHGGQDLVFVKDKDRWRLQKPLEFDADSAKVTELLDKLSGLQARDKDIIDKADPKKYGLDKPAATLKVTAEEEVKGEGDTKTKKAKAWTLTVGKSDADKAKLFVRVDGWERVNAVEDSLWKLVDRPALAYRSRRVLDFATADVSKIEVQKGGEHYTLEQTKGSWRLAAPVSAEVDSSKVHQLADDLSRLEAVEYVAESAKPESLHEQYGLAKPMSSIQLTFTDANKPAQVLLLGKQRPGRDDYFAKLASAPGVFAVKKEIRDELERDSLAYRPQQLWRVPAEDVAELRVRKDEQEYRLKKDAANWKISGPFDAPAVADRVRPMVEELANLRCERFVAHSAKDLAQYGLDKPYLQVGLSRAKKDGKDGDAGKERVLLVGKPTDKDARARFAMLGDGEAVFVIGEKASAALDHAALDLLDRGLLALDAGSIERIRSSGDGGALVVQRQDKEWRVTESPAAAFTADAEAVAALLGVLANLRAERVAAYGPSANPAAYGLDKPTTTVTITAKGPAVDGKPAAPVEHTIALGKPVDGSPGERFARVDNGPGVAVLPAVVVKELTRTHLDLVPRTVFHFDAAGVTGLQRQMDKDDLELTRREDGWHLTKPAEARADAETLDGVVRQLANLRAVRVAAYPAKELMPFGLDQPTAVVTVRWSGENNTKVGDYELKLGKVADEGSGERFALAASAFEGGDKPRPVFVVPGALARRLTGPALHFRNRGIAAFVDADRLHLERGPRRAQFTQADGTWKLTAPVQAEAEQSDLEEFLRGLGRLRADELVADKPADLKPYGLDRPEVRWRVQRGDEEVLNLLIGGREKTPDGKDGERRYAKLAAGDMVFLLSPQLSARALAEYRSRTLWPPLDAVQIDRLSYTQDGKLFVLEKRDNTWHAADQPDAKVRDEAVRETLDALAGLKAARYVEDKADDVKLYGLEPPQVVLEIQTPSGKRVLHVGRPEGETKRYYARVPDGSRADVFIFAEGDAARILRNPSDFSRAK
jgi:hypothetical protein